MAYCGCQKHTRCSLLKLPKCAVHCTAKNSFNEVSARNNFECILQILNSIVCVTCESFLFRIALGENIVFVTYEDAVEPRRLKLPREIEMIFSYRGFEL